MNIGKKLKDYRHRNYITKTKMSEDIGLPSMTIRNIEEGLTNPRLDNILKICKYLGLSIKIVDKEGNTI